MTFAPPERAHAAGHALVDAGDRGALEDVRAVAGHRRREAAHVADGIELALVVERERLDDVEGQRHARRHAHVEAGRARGVGLAVDRAGLLRDGGVRVGRDALPGAVDPLLAHELVDPRDRGEARLRVRRRAVVAVQLADLRVLALLQRRDLRRGQAGRAAADDAALEQRDPRAVALERERGADAGDAAADHGDVDLEIVDERGIGGRRRGGSQSDRSG